MRQLTLYITVTAGILLVAGLFKPWALLWWEDVQNRKKVIILYGTIAIVSYGVHWALFFIKQYV